MASGQMGFIQAAMLDFPVALSAQIAACESVQIVQIRHCNHVRIHGHQLKRRKRQGSRFSSPGRGGLTKFDCDRISVAVAKKETAVQNSKADLMQIALAGSHNFGG